MSGNVFISQIIQLFVYISKSFYFLRVHLNIQSNLNQHIYAVKFTVC